MTAIERINQLSHRIFNTSKSEAQTTRTSNPFAASNFQKNILTEDVFESSKAKEASKVSFTGNLTASSKRIYSTFVGSLGDFGNKFYEGIESIMAFGTRMKDSIVNTCKHGWNKLQEIGNTEISLDGTKEILKRDITSFFINGREREISKLSKMDPHSEVKPMLVEALSALEADMAVVAA
ncbi:hypothetical protein J6A64_03355 [bacterium]|nr:hypothetical protein [bacterium]MBO5446700.1 hypothetical protein [bacterium]